MISPVVRKLRNNGLLKISKAPVSEAQGSNPAWSNPKQHPIYHACYPLLTCVLYGVLKTSKLNVPLQILNTFIFTFVVHDPKVNYHEFLHLLKKKVTVLSILKNACSVLHGFLQANNHKSPLCFNSHLMFCPKQLHRPKFTSSCKLITGSYVYVNHLQFIISLTDQHVAIMSCCNKNRYIFQRSSICMHKKT